VAVEERTERSADRCSLHPGTQAVATCEGCGRALCLWCAVPVRGVAYGSECLNLVIGTPPPVQADTPRRRAPTYVVLGFAIALASTALPWTTFGEGSRIFGAWSLGPRWALLAAVAALVGFGLAFVSPRRGILSDRARDIALVALGTLVVAGSVLEWFRPPFPSRPSVVVWVAAASGAFAAWWAVRCLAEDARAAR
jgi:hypothetical protein